VGCKEGVNSLSFYYPTWALRWKTSIIIDGNLTKILSEYLPNTVLAWYCYTIMLNDILPPSIFPGG
jgi:hypothetical protein